MEFGSLELIIKQENKQRERDQDLGKMCKLANEIWANLDWEVGFLPLPAPLYHPPICRQMIFKFALRASRAMYP